MRGYQPEDREACLSLCEESREALAAYLDAGPKNFMVLEHDGIIVACGGYRVEGTRAELEWGMVAPALQRKGIGRFLLMARLKQIGAEPGVEFAVARVPENLMGFYAKQGFRLDHDSVMLKRLVVCP